MHQIRFPLGPQTPLGELTALWWSIQRFPRPLAVFKGPTSKGMEGKGSGAEGEGKGKGREGETRGGRKGREGGGAREKCEA